MLYMSLFIYLSAFFCIYLFIEVSCNGWRMEEQVLATRSPEILALASKDLPWSDCVELFSLPVNLTAVFLKI